jgi:basic amino acid/polyamine antiporter, APA family
MADRTYDTQGPGDEGLFVRNASGLVREAGATDTVFFNWVAGGGVGLALVYNVYWALNAFPGVDLVATTVLTVPFAFAAVVVFGLLAAAMPRSGGDYVFVSRIVHPAWGFVSSWAGFISVVSYCAFVAWFTAVAFISGSAAVMGEGLGSEPLIEFAGWAASPGGSFILGALVLLLAAGVMAAGLRVALRTITILAVVGLVGLIVSAIVLALNTNDQFITAFNSFAQARTGEANTYEAIIATAAANEFVTEGPGTAPFFESTLPAMVITFYAVGYSVWSIYYAGEFKGGRSRTRQLMTMFIPTVLNSAVFVLLFLLMFRTAGYEFLGAASFVYNYVPDEYPLTVPPFVNFFASLLAGNALANVLISITWVVWPIAMVILIMVGFSRVLFAWSFDGVLPAALADVNERTHSPIKAILVSLALSLVALWLVVNVVEFLTFLAYTVLLALIFWISMAIAGIVFPTRRREVYGASPARWTLGRIPVVTLAGLVLGLFVVFEFVVVFTFEGLGILDRGEAVLVTLAVLGSGLAIFATSWLVRRSRGIDPGFVYREIPPE